MISPRNLTQTDGRRSLTLTFLILLQIFHLVTACACALVSHYFIIFLRLSHFLLQARRLVELELQVALHQICRRFRLENATNEPIKKNLDAVLVPDRPMSIRFMDR